MLMALSSAAAVLAACDQAGAPRIAGLGGTAASSGSDTTGASPLVVSPGQVQLPVGTTFQLSTNAPASLQNQLQWVSLQPSIAGVSTSGLVSALSPGTATIVARYAFDTTRVATATIDVVGTSTTDGTTGSGNSGAP